VYTGATGGGGRLFKIYHNNGNGTFTDIGASLPGLSHPYVAWGDYDNDGDLDLAIQGQLGNQSQSEIARIYRNDKGTFVDAGSSGLSGARFGTLVWGDFDKDGDLDLLQTGYDDNSNQITKVYRNDGGAFTDLNLGLQGTYLSSAAWGDYDNDGYLDFAYVGYYNIFKIYHNNGDGSFTDINSPIVGYGYGSLSWADYDNDGDLDLLVSGYDFSLSRQITKVFRNDGSNNFTDINAGMTGAYREVGPSGGWVDFNNDGRLDAFVTGYNEQIGYIDALYRNFTTNANTVPAAPSGLTAVADEDTVRLSWSGGSDAETPSGGLTYNLRIGTALGKNDVVSSMADSAGYRKIVSLGNVNGNNTWTLKNLPNGLMYWSVQTIDGAFAGSAFAEGGSFRIQGIPDVPTGFLAQARNAAAFLQWNANVETDIALYRIYRSTSPNPTTQSDSTTSTSITVSGLSNGTTYYFRIAAVDNLGKVGPYSTQFSVQPSTTPGHIFVTNNNDAGAGSLRAAITQANNLTQPDTITFQIAIGSSIVLATALPDLSTGYTIIDADSNKDGAPDITLDGTGNFPTGLNVTSDHNTIKGLNLIYLASYALRLTTSDAHDNYVLGNYIGTTLNGLASASNNTAIVISSGAHDNYVGNATTAGRNLISGNNTYGLIIQDAGTKNNYVLGNYIGTNVTGTAALGNPAGVYIWNGAQNNWIGNSTIAGRNLISGNSSFYGVWIEGPTASGNVVAGNYIGTNASGTSPIANGIGVRISSGGQYNKIGDGTTGGRNIISGNTTKGIELNSSDFNDILGNYIGTDVTGTDTVANAQYGVYFLTGSNDNKIGNGTAGGRNLISGNGSDGIHIESSGSDNNAILGNYIGTNASGTGPLGNGTYGIQIYNFAQNNKIGDGTAAGRNIISGNTGSAGIRLYYYANNNSIKGNYIGTDVTGTDTLSNDDGIYVSYYSDNNIISGNVISGNIGEGIGFGGPYPSQNNRILGNFIGTKVGGSSALGNGNGIILDADGINNFIGDGTAAGRNIISGNVQNGIYLYSGAAGNRILGNYIGTNAAGTDSIPNDSSGIWLAYATNNYIGDGTEGGANLISGNRRNGIWDYGVSGTSYSNRIYKNNIGVNSGGGRLGNGLHGILLNSATAQNNDSLSRNTIAYNGGSGISVQGFTTTDNIFYANSIYRNLGGTISFVAGPQDDLAPPRIDSLGLNGKLYGRSAPNALINIYSDSTSGARYFVDTVYANASGNWSKLVDVIGGLNALATQDSAGNTSALSSTFAIPIGSMFVPGTPLAFSNQYVGDSTSQKLRITGNRATISTINFKTGLAFSYSTNMGLPANLFTGDTLIVSIKFKPNSAASFSDSIRVYSNAGQVNVSLSGSGLANNAPRAFATKSPADQAIISALTPTFTWQGRGDPDPGQTLTYTVEVALASNFASILQSAVTSDTSAITGTLSPNAGYYWRVKANDAHQGVTTSNISFLRIDNAAPTLVAGVFGGNVIYPSIIKIYAHSDEILGSAPSGQFIQTNVSHVAVDTSQQTFNAVAGQNDLYFAQVNLTQTGTLEIAITGHDSAGNTGTAHKSYQTLVISKKNPIALVSEDGLVELSGAKESVKNDGFVILGRVQPKESETFGKMSKALSSSSVQESNSAWTQVGASIELLSTVEFEKFVTLQIKYSSLDLGELRAKYINFDERNLGLYADENGQWTYLGGEGDRSQVAARIQKTGHLAILYNPEHVFLPKKVELGQNYPNPFNPTTTIKFGLPESGHVKLTVYNVLGQKVAELINENRVQGFHSIIWNGKNQLGSQVASGVYIYRLEAPMGTVAKKMLLIK